MEEGEFQRFPGCEHPLATWHQRKPEERHSWRKDKGRTIMRRVLQQAMLFVLFVVTAGACLGQSDTARLQGTIADLQGLAVPGATVTVTNTDTGR